MVKLHKINRKKQDVFVSILLALLMFAPCAHSASPIMHRTSFNGGLFWKCPIAGFLFDANFMVTITASHETIYNSFDDSTASSWKIDGLESHLVCNEKNQLAWLSLTGDTAYFDRDMLAKKKNAVDKGRMLVAMSEDEYVVIDEHSRKWHYKRGSLEKVQFGEDGELTFKCSNGQIREIRQGKNATLTVQQQGPVLAFFIKDKRIADIQYDATGQLIEFISIAVPRQQYFNFIYQDRNLVQVNEGDRVVQKFDWREVGVWKKWFTLLQYPFYLYSDGRYTYSHAFYFGDATMTAMDVSGRREEKILNLKTGLIIDR